MQDYVISCESTVDMPYSYISKRNIPVIFYSYSINDKEYVDDMLRTPDAMSDFYRQIDDGKIPSTSQLNQSAYEEFFESLINMGNIMHISLGTGMTKSFQNARNAALALMDKHPDRRIVVIDSLCSSSGYGMLVNYAADMKELGRTIDEVATWVEEHRQNIHHQFFSTRLDFYRRSGRISGPTAMIATIIGICPIMRLDDKGKIIAYSKVRGKNNAIKETLNAMQNHAVNGSQYNGKCYICHSNCLDEAVSVRDAIVKQFPNIDNSKIEIFDIGTIIASHCGPGTVAVFFLGDKRSAS